MKQIVACGSSETPHDIDIPALRERYRRERDKRLRPEGGDQYVEASEAFAGYADVDPHTPPVERDPVSEDIDVAIIGGGFSGLMAATRLSINHEKGGPGIAGPPFWRIASW